jgi:PBP1b-binding outer membrane lipoprotein LpoB
MKKIITLISLALLISACARSTELSSSKNNTLQPDSESHHPPKQKPKFIPFPELIDRKTLKSMILNPRNDSSIKSFQPQNPPSPPQTPPHILKILETPSS